MAEAGRTDSLAETIDGTFGVSFKREECQEIITLSISKASTILEVISISSARFQVKFNAISLFGEELDVNGSFVDYFEPDATFVLHVQPEVASGTLLSECSDELKSIEIEFKQAELLLAKDAGGFMDEFKSKVGDESPVLVLVETELGVDGGFAAVPFHAREDVFVADPTGNSFVFSLRPNAARYPLKEKAFALRLGPRGFWFGDYCLGICDAGEKRKFESTYAVPPSWGTDGFVKFTRFEVWRVAL